MTKPIVVVKFWCINSEVTDALCAMGIQTYWPLVISNIFVACNPTNAASSRPRTFFTPQVFLIGLLLRAVRTRSLDKNIGKEFVYIEIFLLEMYISYTEAEVALKSGMGQ